MSELRTPVTAAFDAQRTAMERSRTSIRRTLEAQQELGGALVGLDTARGATERSHEAVQLLAESYFDTLEAATPDEDEFVPRMRSAFDEQLSALETAQLDTLDTYEANVRDGAESLEDSLDAFETVLDESFAVALETNEEVEAGTFEAIASVEESVAEIEASVEDRLEDASTVGRGTAVEAVDGIGPTYAERLGVAGYETVEELAEAGAAAVASAADVSEAQAETWIESAQS